MRHTLDSSPVGTRTMFSNHFCLLKMFWLFMCAVKVSLLPKKSANATPVTQSLACSSHTGRHRRTRWEIQQDCCKEHSNRSHLCQRSKIRETCGQIISRHKPVGPIGYFKKSHCDILSKTSWKEHKILKD